MSNFHYRLDLSRICKADRCVPTFLRRQFPDINIRINLGFNFLGTAKEKEACIWTIGTVLLEGLKMWGIVVPFAAEAMYQNLRQEFRLKEEKIMHIKKLFVF